jgi:hypothetical protein
MRASLFFAAAVLLFVAVAGVQAKVPEGPHTSAHRRRQPR